MKIIFCVFIQILIHFVCCCFYTRPTDYFSIEELPSLSEEEVDSTLTTWLSELIYRFGIGLKAILISNIVLLLIIIINGG